MLKKQDFAEIEYTGRTADDNAVFDTTSPEVAKDSGMFGPGGRYGPVIICIGEGQVLSGLEQELIGKAPGKEYTVRLDADRAFGRRSAKLIQLINTAKFRKQNITPVPGLQVNIDNMTGLIKTVTGGRTLVDFNHPLASRELVYSVKINRIVEDPKEKAASLISLLMPDAKVEFSDGSLAITTKLKLPEDVQKALADRIKKLVPEVKHVAFT